MMVIFSNIKNFSIKLKKAVAVMCTAAAMISGAAYAPVNVFENAAAPITAEAAVAVTVPKISVKYVFSNMATFQVSGLSSYPSNTVFKFYVAGIEVKSYPISYLKKCNVVCIDRDSKNYFKPGTYYSIRASAVSGSTKSRISEPTMIKTAASTDYRINAKTPLYTLSGGKMISSGSTDVMAYVKGILTTAKGVKIAGLASKSYTGSYLLINDGAYKGKYVKVNSSIARMTVRDAKIKKVVQYAVGMNGGRYVWGGASYRACDCSGLTMLSYQQVGVDITHSCYIQAQKGKASSLGNIKEGDVIICNNYGHAALYIGNGKIIHAMNSYYGIQIQDISKLSYCGAVNAVRTII